MQIDNFIVVDCETFYEKGVYDLRSMSMTEYLRDPRFKLHGYAQSISYGAYGWSQSIDKLNEYDWPKTALVSHNIKFDGSILAWHYGIKPALYVDTIGLAKALLGELVPNYRLDTLAAYFKLPSKGKELAEFSGKRYLTSDEERKLAEYCLRDTEIAAGIFKALWPHFPKNQWAALDWTARAFIEPILELDVKRLERMVEDEKQRREILIAESGVDRRVLSSNKQFATLLKERGLPVVTKRSARTGLQIPALGVSDSGFKDLLKLDPKLAEGRKAAKSNLVETRGSVLIRVGQTGKFPFDINYSGATQTHRYSGGSGAGGNPQNFPREGAIKESICAPEGSKIICGDFSKIELCFNAWLAKEEWLMDALRNGDDIYSMFGTKVYGRTITEKDQAERQFGKTCELGLGYNMGADKFQDRVLVEVGEEISKDRAKEIVKLYRDEHPQIVGLWKQAEKLLPLMRAGTESAVWFCPALRTTKNAIILPSGLQIKYPNLRSLPPENGKHGWKRRYIYDVYYKAHETSPEGLYGGKIVENVCQALTGELCKEAIDNLVNAGLKVVGQVHDEILVVAKDADVERARRLMEHFMTKSPVWFKDLAVRAKIGIGQNWKSAKL